MQGCEDASGRNYEFEQATNSPTTGSVRHRRALDSEFGVGIPVKVYEHRFDVVGVGGLENCVLPIPHVGLAKVALGHFFCSFLIAFVPILSP